jgi:hypothetical protein
MIVDTRSVRDVEREVAMRDKAKLGIYPLPVRPPEPTKCAHCGHVSAAIVCTICKRPK